MEKRAQVDQRVWTSAEGGRMIDLPTVLHAHVHWLHNAVDGQRADLRSADLNSAYLHGTNLRTADLRNTNFRSADLSNADLSHADLRNADLRNAYLRGAYLRGANLRCANLSESDLRDADLRDADLTNTCLDPAAPLPPISIAVLLATGLTPAGNLVYGWRTATSQHCGETTYKPGERYDARWFSIDVHSPCHPGIYLASKEWLRTEYPGVELVEIMCRHDELLRAGSKWRAKRIWIL